MMNNQFRRAWDQAVIAAERRRIVKGLLGHPDGVIAVPGRPAFVYVRVTGEANRSLAMARNPNAVPLRLHLPIEMMRIAGELVIQGVDSARWEEATSGDTANVYGIEKHTHRLGTGLEYEVEALRFEPGRVQWDNALEVAINPFRYYYNGAWDTYEGGLLNLYTLRPSTAGHWAWVVVGINPATNTAVAVAGTSQTYATPLTISQIDSVAFGNYIPLAAIKVRNDDTSLDDITLFQDAHQWYSPPANTLSFVPTVTTGSFTIPANYALVVPYLEIGTDHTVTLEDGAVLSVVG